MVVGLLSSLLSQFPEPFDSLLIFLLHRLLLLSGGSLLNGHRFLGRFESFLSPRRNAVQTALGVNGNGVDFLLGIFVKLLQMQEVEESTGVEGGEIKLASR